MCPYLTPSVFIIMDTFNISKIKEIIKELRDEIIIMLRPSANSYFCPVMLQIKIVKKTNNQ